MSEAPRRDPSEYLRLHWGAVLADALHRGVHREVTRNDRVSAALVPPDWYEAAQRVVAALEPRSWTSRVGREELAVLLDVVEYEGAHVVITRYGRVTCCFVPVEWYRSLLHALATREARHG